ncbi:AbiU2 domain-containing protein [Pseudomonas syringae]|uniref:AbiU2 domain-containing protein n=1 Tax=Pseudomonas syringae TaxID=317 RepID=UPI000CDA52F9|nr:hypothetical protein [Pseudomonas syringae]POR65110.1 hypothetical protein BKM10_10250 [Pseudomonas syringae pv. syringae]
METDNLSVMRYEYVSAMGEELGSVFFALHHEVIYLGIVWQQYMQLYGNSAENINTLNQTAGLFFKVIQNELWDSVLLQIAALTDPATIKGKKNITLLALPALVQDPVMRGEIQKLCDLALCETEYAREHRNKRIAHNDHDYHVVREAVCLSGISRTKVEEMLIAIRNVLKYVQHKIRDVDFLYDRFIDESGAALLLRKLKNSSEVLSCNRRASPI